MSAQWGESQRLFPWMAHLLPCPSPGSGLRMVDCARDGPTGAQGKVVVLGASPDSCQCLRPSRGSLELGGGDEFVKNNHSLSGTKEGGVRAPQEYGRAPRPQPQPCQNRAEEGGLCRCGSERAKWAGLLASSTLRAVAEDNVEGRESTWYLHTLLLLILKSVPLCFGGCTVFPFPPHFCMFY